MNAPRIMIVEDEFIVASDIRQTLVQYGYEVVAHEASGEDALVRAAEIRPDLVLMDVVLRGELSGIETANELERRLGIPVIFLTSYADAETLEKAKVSAPYGFLVKPYKDRELRATIETALHRIGLEGNLRTRESELLEANRLLEAVFASTDVLLVYLDRHFNFVRVNRAYAEAGRREPENFVGKNYFDLYPGTESKRVFFSVLETGHPHVAKGKAFPHPDPANQDTTYWDWSLVPVKGAEGEVTHLVLSLAEVTARINFSMALEKAGKELQTIIDSVPSHIVMKDTENNFLRVNRSFAEALGVTPLEVVGRSARDFFPQEVADRFLEEDRAVIASGQPRKGILEHGGQAQEKRHFSTDRIPLFDEDGSVARILVVATDITSLVEAEQELREDRARLQAVLDSIEAVVYVADMQTYEILLVNEYARRIFGKVEGRTCWKALQDGQTGPCGFCTNPQLVDDKGNPSRGLVWEVENTRNRRWYECHDRAFRWLDGRLVRIEIATDITDRKFLEQEVQKARNLESLGILAGGIAHDFNNLLTTIMGNIELVKIYTGREDRVRSWLDEAVTATEGARHLTNHLLTFSRGGFPVRELTSVHALVDQACSFALSGANIEWVVDFPEEAWPVRANRGQLSQVFHNLVMNSREAMPGGGRITIQGQNVDLPEANDSLLPAGRYLQVEVRDTGQGIPAEILPKVFDPYFSTKPMGESKGMGLGLAICYSIVGKHGGHISLTSKPGEGTRVIIRLPATTSGPADKTAPTTRVEPAHKHDNRSLGRVLFMEDDEPIIRVTGEIFRHLRYDFEVAREGHEAVAIYSKARNEGRPFDVVILDLTVRGGMGALPTLERLKEVNPEVRAVVSSGYGDDPVIMGYEDFGFRAALVKPYRVDNVKDVLDRLLMDSASGPSS